MLTLSKKTGLLGALAVPEMPNPFQPGSGAPVLKRAPSVPQKDSVAGPSRGDAPKRLRVSEAKPLPAPGPVAGGSSAAPVLKASPFGEEYDEHGLRITSAPEKNPPRKYFGGSAAASSDGEPSAQVSPATGMFRAVSTAPRAGDSDHSSCSCSGSAGSCADADASEGFSQPRAVSAAPAATQRFDGSAYTASLLPAEDLLNDPLPGFDGVGGGKGRGPMTWLIGGLLAAYALYSYNEHFA